MVWKIFSLLSAALLGVSSYYAYSSKNDLKNEKELRERALSDEKKAAARKKEGDEKLVVQQNKLTSMEGDVAKAKQEVEKAAAEAKNKDSERQTAQQNDESINKQLAEVQKAIDDAGDIKKFLSQVNTLKQEQSTAESELANQTQALAAIQSKTAAAIKETDRVRDIEANARKGFLEPGFTARVAQSFNDWGFAVLNKGNNSGMIANAELEVKRGTSVVAKLKVRNVEQNISVADILPESVTDGSRLRSGDLVVAVPAPERKSSAPASTPAPSTTTAPVAPAADPAAAPATPGDPFNTTAAPAPAAPTAPATPATPEDPFKTPPASSGADPFQKQP
jgi:hypothetical protein